MVVWGHRMSQITVLQMDFFFFFLKINVFLKVVGTDDVSGEERYCWNCSEVKLMLNGTAGSKHYCLKYTLYY